MHTYTHTYAHMHIHTCTYAEQTVSDRTHQYVVYCICYTITTIQDALYYNIVLISSLGQVRVYTGGWL